MKELRGKNVQISDTVLLRRAAENKKYLLSLDSDKLLLPKIMGRCPKIFMAGGSFLPVSSGGIF